MYAILIPLQDLYYAVRARGNDYSYCLDFNMRLFTPELIELFDSGEAELFVLLDRPATGQGPQFMLAPDKMTVTYDWDTMLNYLENDLDDYVADMPKIHASHDLAPASYQFTPNEKKWHDASYTKRILVTHITAAPDKSQLAAYGVESVRMQSSYISAHQQQATLNELQALRENLTNRDALIILDNDDTMLNNKVSRLQYRTVLNDSVMAFAKQLREQLISSGATVTCLSMSAREKHLELDSRRQGHPSSMECIAEHVNKTWFPLLFDHYLSFSYPRHTLPSKRTKLVHLFHLINEGRVSVEGGVVILFDDCRKELDEDVLSYARTTLKEQLNCELFVVPACRYAFTPASVLERALTPQYGPATPLHVPHTLFHDIQPAAESAAIVTLEDEFETLSLA